MGPGVLRRKQETTWATGKHVLITGASKGIGREICENLLGSCNKIILVARDEATLATFASELNRLQQAHVHQTKIEWHALDVQDVSAMMQLIHKIYDIDKNRVDVFINCAGGSHIYDTFEHFTHADITQIFRTNGEAPIHWLRELLPRMINQEPYPDSLKRAHIMLLSSRSAERVLPKLVVYGSAKGAVDKLTEGLRREYAKHHIAFTIIHPGSINTYFTASWNQHDKNDHNEQSMNVSEVAPLIIQALDIPFVINEISFESIEQLKTELGVL